MDTAVPGDNPNAARALPYAILDSDQHMVEPLDLWRKRVDKKFRDDAPHAVENYKGKEGKFLVFGDEVMRIMYKPDDAMLRPGGSDPAARLKDMEIDGVAAAVLFPTYGMFVFGTDRAELQEACFAAYNDWLAEFCGYAPDRYAGMGMLSLYNIEHAVKEMERCRKIGLKGTMIWDNPPEDIGGYGSPYYTPLWETAQAIDMPLVFHIRTGGPNSRKVFTPAFEKDWGTIYTSNVMSTVPLQTTLCSLAFSGVMDRFPKVKFICGEADVGWLPGLMGRADKYYASRFRRGHDIKLSTEPSKLIARSVWHSFIDDHIGMEIYQHGDLADRIMWATDYPHPACFFPKSLDVVARDFSHMPADDKRKLLHDNVAALFDFKY